MELDAYETRLGYLHEQLGLQKKNLQSNIAQISNPLILKLREELAESERRAMILIAQGVTEDYADLKDLRERQKGIKERLITETQKLIINGLASSDPLAQAQDLVSRVVEAETEIRTLVARSNALEQIVTRYNKKLEKLPEKSLRLARLSRNKLVDEKLYYMLKEKFEESRISMAGKIGKIRIIDRAQEPGAPIEPKVQRSLLLGLLFGIGSGILLVIFLDFLDKSVRSVEDIENLKLPVLGAIPHIEAEKTNGFFKNGKTKSEAYQATMITRHQPKSPISEAYRSIRTNIQFSQAATKFKTVLITSSVPSEGKSTTAVNLAVTIAKMGVKTLLIDADLRKPVLHRFFDFEKEPGLTNYLVSNAVDILQSSEINNLYVLTSGVIPPNPSELLGSKRFQEMLKKLELKHDLIIIDTPPIIAVTDAQVVASNVDGVIVVARAGVSQIDTLKRVKSQLENINAKVLGVVLNDVRAQHMYGSYYYYHYYNRYGYGDEEEQNGQFHIGKKRRIVQS